MIISKLQAHPLRLPFKMSYSHSLATRSQMSSVLVIVHTSGGVVGYGEGAPREYVSGESLESAMARIVTCADRLIGVKIKRLEDIDAQLNQDLLLGAPSARCALELAMIDALAKSKERTALSLFGPIAQPQPRYSATISGGSTAQASKMAAMSKKLGFAQAKLKVGPDLEHNMALLDAILAHLDPQAVELRADANACWTLSQALEQIPKLVERGVRIIEQPLAQLAHHQMPALATALGDTASLVVDESLIHDKDARWFIQHGGAARFLIKISKQGGLIPALKMARLALAHGIQVHLGCHVGESSLLSAAGRIFAALIDPQAVEGSFGTLLLERDITPEPLEFGPGGLAQAQYSALPGLGVPIEHDALEALLMSA